MIPGTIPHIRTKRPSITFLHSTFNASTTATVSMGTASPTTPGLLVVVYVSSASVNRAINNVSIGGTTATIHVSAGAARPRAVASRLVSSGANAISILTASTAASAANHAAAWLITGYRSTTPLSTGDSVASVGNTSVSFAIDVVAASVGAFGSFAASTVAITWSGGPTTVAESTSGVTRGSFAQWDVNAPKTAATVKTSGSASTFRSIIGAVWR